MTSSVGNRASGQISSGNIGKNEIELIDVKTGSRRRTRVRRTGPIRLESLG
jgi:hypothetical protein